MAKSKKPPPAWENTPMRTVRISDHEWAYFTTAARQAGESVSEFMRSATRERAARVMAATEKASGKR